MTFVSGLEFGFVQLSNTLQILGLAILTVFCLGYGKVVWRNRIVQRQEILDEEKRLRIQELRSSGQIIESRKSQDVPFGVKAIESGIQVDGIWISKSNSPVPSEFKLGHLHGEPDTVEASDSNTNPNGTQSTETSQQPTRPTSRGRPLFRAKDSAGLPQERSPIFDDLSDLRGSAGSRVSFKPRKSSHLRYGSYGETHYDETTLDQLEGNTTPKRKVLSHKSRASRQIEPEADASAADNEQSSGTSSDSDATLSSKLISPEYPKHQSTPSQHPTQRIGSVGTQILSDLPSSKATRFSFPIQNSSAEYISVPLGSPENESLNPFASSYHSSMEGSPLSSPATELFVKSKDHTRSPRQSQNRTPPSFVPGELHMNKSVRKVNSGFEVLPAGTFGVPTTVGSHDSDRGGQQGSPDESRRQSKLQKKRQTSVASVRLSSTFDRT